MKSLIIFVSVLALSLAVVIGVSKAYSRTPCWCWSEDQGMVAVPLLHPKSTEYSSFGSYGSEVDWANPQHILPLNYDQTQGKRIYYEQCVWCHSDATPAGPSNRSNVTPTPPLMNDGSVFNSKSDDALLKAIQLGGRATGKSPMMPPYGRAFSEREIREIIAYMRVIASPAYGQPIPKAPAPSKSNDPSKGKSS